MSKKGASELTFNKVIILILVILVILGVLIFLFKVDIMEKIRNLPGYESNPDQTINLSEDQLKLLNYAPVGQILAPEKRDYSLFNQWYFEVYKIDSNYSILQKIRTRIMLDWAGSTSQSNGNIVIARAWETDIVIGQMIDNRLTLTVSKNDYLNYKRIYDSLPDYSDLIKLNNAKYLGGTLFITKEILTGLPPAAQLNKVQDIIIPDIENKISYSDGVHYKISLAPYFNLKPDTAIQSYRNMFFYARNEKDSIGIYMKKNIYDADYSDTSLAGRIYPAQDTWGRIYMSDAVGNYWEASKETNYDIHNPSKGYSPVIYETNLWVNYTKLRSAIHISA